MNSQTLAYESRIEECEVRNIKLKDEIAIHEEQAIKLNRQYIINRDNIDRWGYCMSHTYHLHWSMIL